MSYWHRISEIVMLQTCVIESDDLWFVLNSTTTSPASKVTVTGHVLTKFSVLYYFYTRQVLTDLHFSHFQASFQDTSIFRGRLVCFNVVHLKFAFWWVVNICKQVRTSINYKTHVLVKHDLYNEIDNYMQLIFHLCSHFRVLIMCKSVSNVNFSVFGASISKNNDDPQKPFAYFSCSICM